MFQGITVGSLGASEEEVLGRRVAHRAGVTEGDPVEVGDAVGAAGLEHALAFSGHRRDGAGALEGRPALGDVRQDARLGEAAVEGQFARAHDATVAGQTLGLAGVVHTVFVDERGGRQRGQQKHARDGDRSQNRDLFPHSSSVLMNGRVGSASTHPLALIAGRASAVGERDSNAGAAHERRTARGGPGLLPSECSLPRARPVPKTPATLAEQSRVKYLDIQAEKLQLPLRISAENASRCPGPFVARTPVPAFSRRSRTSAAASAPPRRRGRRGRRPARTRRWCAPWRGRRGRTTPSASRPPG